MTRFIGGMLVLVVASSFGMRAWADSDKDPKAILDKAIKALGGEEKLNTVKAASWKTKGKINIGGNEAPITAEATVQGLDHSRQQFETEFGGNMVKGTVVLAGDKGWRNFGDMKMELDKNGVMNEKRNLYLLMTPITLLPLQEKGFKIEAAPDEKVDGKPAMGIKATGPDGKDFTIYFDKESGLPVRQVAKVLNFMGEETAQETTFGNYKDFDGIKKATKIETKRDGEKFMEAEITDFKVLDKVDPKTFSEPQ
jgi:hypothetical protein